MPARPAAGGGRWVEVDPDRLPRWLDGFDERHGPVEGEPAGNTVTLVGADGTSAELHAPPGALPPGSLDDLVEEARRPRRLGQQQTQPPGRGGAPAGAGWGGGKGGEGEGWGGGRGRSSGGARSV